MIGRMLLACMLLGASIASAGADSREDEIALAVSGGPEHLRKDAAVYVLEKDKYVKVREGTNGFSCVVLRDTPQSMEPICYDPEGSRTNMIVDFKRSELRRAGASEPEIEKQINEGYKTGTLSVPKRAGVVYMLSDNNNIYNPETGKVFHYPGHYMFIAPFLKNSDIGARDSDSGNNLPWVLNEGTPGAYIIVVAGGGSHQH